MIIQSIKSKSLNWTLGLGWIGVLTLLGTITSLFLLWSLFCLVGGAVSLATGMC